MDSEKLNSPKHNHSASLILQDEDIDNDNTKEENSISTLDTDLSALKLVAEVENEEQETSLESEPERENLSTIDEESAVELEMDKDSLAGNEAKVKVVNEEQKPLSQGEASKKSEDASLEKEGDVEIMEGNKQESQDPSIKETGDVALDEKMDKHEEKIENFEDQPAKEAKKLVDEGNGIENTNMQTADAEASSKMQSIDPIFEKCKSFAMHKESHLLLIKDEFLSNFLIYYMASDDPTLAFRALEIINLFATSSNDEARIALGNIPYFFDGVQAAAGNQKLGEEICDFANSIYLKVKLAHENQNKPKKAKKRALGTSSVQNESHTSDITTNETTQSKANNWKTIYYYVPECIFKTKRLLITAEILKLRGILSITYDLRRTYLVVRTKRSVPKNLIGETVNKLGFETKFVNSKDAEKSIMLAPPTPAAPILQDPKTCNLDQTGINDFDDEEEDVGLAVDTLDSEKENSTTSNWFGAAKNMFQKSFFW